MPLRLVLGRAEDRGAPALERRVRIVAALERGQPFLHRGSLRVPFAHPVSLRGPVAQLVEQGTFNPKVTGSIPVRPIQNCLQIKPSAVASRADAPSVVVTYNPMLLNSASCATFKLVAAHFSSSKGLRVPCLTGLASRFFMAPTPEMRPRLHAHSRGACTSKSGLAN